MSTRTDVLSWNSVSVDQIVACFRVNSEILNFTDYTCDLIPSWRDCQGFALGRLVNLLGFDGSNEKNRKWLYDQLRRNTNDLRSLIQHGSANVECGAATPESDSAPPLLSEIRHTISTETVVDGALKPNWYDAVLPIFSSQLNCTLCIRRGRLNKTEGVVTAEVYCSHPDCRDFFKLRSDPSRAHWLMEIRVAPSSHAIRPRPLRGERREELAEEVARRNAFVVQTDLVASAGLSCETPLTNALRFASCRLQQRLSEDPFLNLVGHFEAIQPTFARNVAIQCGANEPEFVLMWHDRAFEILRTLQHRGHPIVLGMDSTGAPVKLSAGADAKATYYHAIVLRHPDGGAPIALMELLSTSQTGVTLKYCVDCLTTNLLL